MAKYIDAEKVIAALTDTLQYEGMVMDELISVVANIPAADVIEPIRCKDCVYSDWYKSVDGKELCYCMRHESLGNGANDYCSRAERQEE